MADGAVTAWKNRFLELQEKSKRFRANIKEHSERGSKIVVGAVLTGAGGAAAAVLDAKMPTIAGMPSKVAVGGALVSLALLDVAGDYGEQLTELGSGMLAVAAYEQTQKALAK